VGGALASLYVQCGSWLEKERRALLQLVAKHGTGNWSQIAEELGTGRTAFGCRYAYYATVVPRPKGYKRGQHRASVKEVKKQEQQQQPPQQQQQSSNAAAPAAPYRVQAPARPSPSGGLGAVGSAAHDIPNPYIRDNRYAVAESLCLSSCTHSDPINHRIVSQGCARGSGTEATPRDGDAGGGRDRDARVVHHERPLCGAAQGELPSPGLLPQPA
jgi:hypothetical protein